jgi:ankyrin repeat protein
VQSRLSFFGAADKDGITPLMYAARYGWNDLVDPLLEGGVDITPKDANGRSAIEHARDAGHVEIVERLQKPRD